MQPATFFNIVLSLATHDTRCYHRYHYHLSATNCIVMVIFCIGRLNNLNGRYWCTDDVTLKNKFSFMSSHDLIFSNRPACRISRHLMFWVFWLVFGYSITWLPNNSRVFMPFFSNWNYHELLQRIYKQDVFLHRPKFQFHHDSVLRQPFYI